MRKLVAALTLLAAVPSFADVDTDTEARIVEIDGAIALATRDGKEIKLDLPPGYFFTRKAFNITDAELVRLQKAEAKLKAENDSLKSSLQTEAGVSPATVAIVVSIVSTVATALGAGAYALTHK